MRQPHITTFLLVSSLFLVGSVRGDDLAADDLKQFAVTAAEAPKETKAGRMVADRAMARSMIEYGFRMKKPQAILLGVEILHNTPVKTVKGDGENVDELKQLVKKAVAIGPENELLIELAEMALESLEEAARGLEGGPQSWKVQIEKKGDFYQLDPRLIYNAHEKAIITAISDDPNVMLGATVRRGDQKQPLKRSVGKGTIRIEWNAGITTTGWDVRIYRLSDGANKIEIETN